MRLFSLLFTLLIVISGCSTKGAHTYKASLKPFKKPIKKEPISYTLKNKNAISLSLYDEYLKWYGTPYKLGGNTLRGVDCSFLVQRIYRDAFGIRVPRTTKQQAKTGYKIDKASLREGDLLLFQTGYNIRHSGIYLERGNFINASTKHGVIISNINNPYWRSKYWQSRRVLP